MKTRICPLCDQPMRKQHHCDICHSFVWKPVYLDIHYSTAEFQGEDCSYDAMNHDYEYKENGSVTMMPSERTETNKNRKFRGAEEIDFPTVPRAPKTSSTGKSGKKDGCLKSSSIFALLIWLLFVFAEIIFEFLF